MILLDTQVAFWSVTDPHRVGAAAKARMSASRCFVSAISIVEFRIKEMKGKLTLPPALGDLLATQGFHPLPFTSNHGEGLLRFPSLSSHDPFDRMLVAQAAVDGLTLMTSDGRLLALDKPWIVDATQ